MTRALPARRQPWTEAQLELLRLHYADTRTADLAQALGRPTGSTYQKAAKLGLRKSPELVAQMACERSADPAHGGCAHRFRKGLVPANKGKKMPAGWAPGDMARTQFKKGHMPHTWKPVGTYAINGDGVLDQKVSEAPGPRHVRWKPVTRLVWEQAHGPVPAGHAVVFKPGRQSTDSAQITPDALELLTRAQLMQRNSFHNWPKPLEELVLLRGRLNRQINQRAKEAATP